MRTALIQNPLLSETDILRSILQDLGVRPETGPSSSATDIKPPSEVFNAGWMAGMSKKELLDRLNIFLAERVQEDVFTVLIIDESQNLSLELLEQLRLLSNLETAKKKLMQIIFAGQLELDKKLNLPAMKQLNQRISVRFETQTLTRDDTERYIRYRLVVAGGAPRLRWGRGAFKAIHEYSRGFPRLINLICDRALLAAFSERSFLITPKMVRKAVRSLEGKEDVMVYWIPLWMKKLVPITAAIVVLLLLLAGFAWRGTLATIMKPPQKAPVQVNQVKMEQPRTEPEINPPVKSPMQVTPLLLERTSNFPQSGYALQVHSFRNQEEAEKALATLKKKNWDGFVMYTAGAGQSEWYAVFIGPFKDVNSAMQGAAALSREENLSAIIRRFTSERQ